MADTKPHERSIPETVGPGIWHVIHTEAWHARTPEQRAAFMALMRRICDNFPCPACRGHCLEHLQHDPMEGRAGDLGLFAWSVAFHNAVNNRLGKPAVPYNVALAKFQRK